MMPGLTLARVTVGTRISHRDGRASAISCSILPPSLLIPTGLLSLQVSKWLVLLKSSKSLLALSLLSSPSSLFSSSLSVGFRFPDGPTCQLMLLFKVGNESLCSAYAPPLTVPIKICSCLTRYFGNFLFFATFSMALSIIPMRY